MKEGNELFGKMPQTYMVSLYQHLTSILGINNVSYQVKKGLRGVFGV
jgi:hypothetical protein